MTQLPGLLELLSDARVGAVFAARKAAMVVGRDGTLLFANRNFLNLLRVASRREAADAVAAERGPFASALRLLDEAVEAAPQTHVLPLRTGGSRRAVSFSGRRVTIGNHTPVFLLVADEPANGAPEIADAARAAFVDRAEPFALFAVDGRKIYANPAAANLVGGAPSLSELLPGSQNALAKARSEGSAELHFGVLRMSLRRIGDEADPAIAVTFAAPPRPEAQPAPSIVAAPPARAAAIEAEAREETAMQAQPVAEAPNQIAAQAVAEPEAPDPAVEPPQPRDGGEADIAPADEAEPEPAAAEVAEAEPEPEVSGRAPKPPSRFVWQIDAEGRFTSVSPELAIIVGEGAAGVTGMDWREAGARIGIEGTGAAAMAVARRDTWSGVTVVWPVDGGAFVRPVELAALPVFDRERRFLGYRGFGVFREPLPRPRKEKDVETGAPAPEKGKPAPEPPAPLSFDDLPPEPPVFGKRQPNVVPLHKGGEPVRITLSPTERNAFREIARAIGTRMNKTDRPAPAGTNERPSQTRTAGQSSHEDERATEDERAVLDRLPLGVIVHRNDRVLYANRTLLEWTGFDGAPSLEKAGGLARLFAGKQEIGPQEIGDSQTPIAIRGRDDEPIPVEARLVSAPWGGEAALVYVLRRAGSGIDQRIEAGELALRKAEGTVREMRSILDTATDGVALLDRGGRVLNINRSAEALFGFDAAEIEGRNFTALFAPESHRAAMDYLDGLATNGVASVLNDGREVIGRVREGGLIPLFMTLGRIDEAGEKFCAVFRDITQWKRAEEELVHARRQAERANSAKSDFLAKISHEIRTPLSSIIGFAEVMMEERFGPVTNERYREYLKDIHTSGQHLVSLINDLLDLSKIEAGKLDLTFASVDLNEIASQSMALMQPQANRERIIIRTALSPNLPPVVADARSIRQIVLNLLSNSIRFTPPGGQVIVSTTLTEEGEVHLRVRDTGVGMTEAEIKTALEPFRQITTAGRGKEGGTGLGLPLTKALVEANRASFAIRSTVNAGTLVEIAFPSTRVLAE